MTLTPEEYQNLKAIFNEALEMAPDARTAFLRSAVDTGTRLEVEKMLDAADAEDDPLETSAFDHLELSVLPEMVGPFRVTREIGRGGMGTVYEATRTSENFTQRAAVKVIRNGMNNETILRRFRAEQKILASLEHPNIARFLDGGTTADGLPYYAMEFVDGSPIGEYCRENECSERTVVEIFRQVCSAVSRAHSQLVVHRDLKPSNILVDRSGTPKLLDFGIAKVLENNAEGDQTATQLGMMTPQYASPEQIRGEKITTATDVYSLGIILHELIHGKPPYSTDDKTLAEVIELVSNESARALTQSHRGDDLSQIISKALRRDLDRRYSSVESLSDDLRRWLQGLPVTARPETFVYRFRKFAQRNRIAVIAASVVFLSLVTGIFAAAWQARRAEEQRLLAERRFAEVRNLANNVVFKYHDEIAKLDGSTGVREMLITDALVYLDALSADAAGDAGLQRELALAYIKLGDVQGRLYSANTGNTQGSFASYRKAVALLENAKILRPDDLQIVEDLFSAYDSLLLSINRSPGDGYQKEELLDRAGQLLDELLAGRPNDERLLVKVVMFHIRSGDAHGNRGNIEGLKRKLELHIRGLPAVDRLEQISDSDPARLQAIARMFQRLGTDHMWIGEEHLAAGNQVEAQRSFAEGIAYHERMVSVVERLAKVEPNASESRRIRIAAYSSLAELLANTERRSEALDLAKTALGLANEGRSADPSNREAEMDIANVHTILGKIYAAGTDAKEAERNYLSAFEHFKNVRRLDPTNLEAAYRMQQTLPQLEKIASIAGNNRKATEYRSQYERLTAERNPK